MSTDSYTPQQIEEKWLKTWEKLSLFQDTADQEIGRDGARDSRDAREKIYLLFAFAYPSGSGLHVGHVESKTALDILARYHRMNGKAVFFPVGWDAFGLPAENYAIKTGVHPEKTTVDAINTFRRQIKRVGISYDWVNEIATSHPGYYQWTQWLFLKLYESGLAYRGVGMVNWCPSCQTVLANEQVVDGHCERCDHEVIQKEMEQWFFKITDYKDELIEGLEDVDWPEATKQQQLNWIGKSEGAEVIFSLAEGEVDIPCFTTRIDTIFGTTFLAISPEKFNELELINSVATGKKDEVQNYIDQAFKKTEEERQIGEKDKTGVDTGLKVINPVNGEEVALFVADYVLGGYGTGAVMGVPAHDERDFAFAQKHEIEIKQVISWPEQTEWKYDVDEWQDYYAVHGVMVHSGKYDGLDYREGSQKLIADFDQITAQTTYKLRDWLISRQRYWGAPIPIVYDPEGKPHPVKEEHLPWELPTDVDFNPTGESPLKSSKEFHQRTEKLYGEGWRPEYDTMDTFVDSSWYFLRYVSSRDEAAFASQEQLAKWLPVDFYMIGPEHIVLHLLYSRFFTKFLRDQGYLNFDEPFMKMRHQGMILGPDGRKMSKSKGNVINPDEVIAEFGADTLRIYEMFMGPIESDKPWDTSSVNGVHRFLRRVFDLVQKWTESVSNDLEKVENEALQRKLHQALKKVTDDIPQLKFNTAIAMMMELVNEWEAVVREAENGHVFSREEMVMLAQMMAPFAPFLAEELYEMVTDDGAEESVHLSSWPVFDAELARAVSVDVPVQVNGKIRGELQLEHSQLEDEDAVLKLAKELENVTPYLEGKKIVKEIYVPGKIVSLVIK